MFQLYICMIVKNVFLYLNSVCIHIYTPPEEADWYLITVKRAEVHMWRFPAYCSSLIIVLWDSFCDIVEWQGRLYWMFRIFQIMIVCTTSTA